MRSSLIDGGELVRPWWLKISFHGLDGFAVVRQSLCSYIRRLLPHNYISMEVALNEAVNNAIEHGGTSKCHYPIEVTLDVVAGRCLIIRVKDPGTGFDGNRILKNLHDHFPDTEGEASLISERGRGLAIMMAATDHICYNHTGNEVLLMKRIHP